MASVTDRVAEEIKVEQIETQIADKPSNMEGVREQLESDIRSGVPRKDAVEKAKASGAKQATAYNWADKVLKEENAPQSVAPPPRKDAKTPGSGSRKGGGARPITEETAQQLLAGIFSVAAMVHDPEWFLTPEEKKALGGPLADSLKVLPAPIADSINTYAAPGVFVTTLGSVVYAKYLRIEAKRKMAALDPRRVQQSNAQPPQTPPVKPANPPPPPPSRATGNPPANRGFTPPPDAPPVVTQGSGGMADPVSAEEMLLS